MHEICTVMGQEGQLARFLTGIDEETIVRQERLGIQPEGIGVLGLADDEQEWNAYIDSMEGNPKTIDPNGGPSVTLDANVVFSGLVAEDLKSPSRTVLTLVRQREIQLCLVPPIVREMRYKARTISEIPGGKRSLPIKPEHLGQLDDLIQHFAINVSRAQRFELSTLVRDWRDKRYLCAALLAVQQSGANVYLVTKDHDLLTLTPRVLRDHVLMKTPRTFLKSFQHRNDVDHRSEHT